MHFHAWFSSKPRCQMLRAVHGTVLAAGAAETHLKIGEIPFQEALHVVVYKRIHMLQECEDLPILLKKLNNRGVHTRIGFESLVLAGIVGAAAVENVSTAVAGSVLRNALFEGETVYGYRKQDRTWLRYG